MSWTLAERVNLADLKTAYHSAYGTDESWAAARAEYFALKAELDAQKES